jgi:carbon storage regulator
MELAKEGHTKEELPMLVLSRKLGERILVPQSELTVTVVDIDGKTVKLGISAPAEVGVYREELWRKVCQGKMATETHGKVGQG